MPLPNHADAELPSCTVQFEADFVDANKKIVVDACQLLANDHPSTLNELQLKVSEVSLLR